MKKQRCIMRSSKSNYGTNISHTFLLALVTALRTFYMKVLTCTFYDLDIFQTHVSLQLEPSTP